MSNINDTDNIQYTYPIYPWEKDWSQVYIYQWHLVDHGEFQDYDFGPASVRKTLEQIKKIDNVTRGIPKVIILCGWQTYVQNKATWDTQFPSFVVTSDDFIDKTIGETPEDAIRWLMAEAKKYNTDVSFHLDFALAQEHSPLWKEYAELDLLCKNADGSIRDYTPHWEGRVNLKREFDAGLFQRRIAEFIETYPEVLNTKLLHNDWNTVESSDYHGISTDDDIAALRRCMAWIKKTYRIDTSCEVIAAGGRYEYDYGMQCMSLSFCRFDDAVKVDYMKVPAYILCGGDAGDILDSNRYDGKLKFSDYHNLFGSSIQGEGGNSYCEDNYKSGVINNRLFRDFCYGTLTWYYLNRLLRISFDEDIKKVIYSDNVVSYIENDMLYITKDGEYIRCGSDIFIPALWKIKNKEIMAWSDNGYKNKRWKLPENWSEYKSVDLYNNNLTGISFRETLQVGEGGYLTFSLYKYDGVIIVPCGANPNEKEPAYIPSGSAEFIGTDTVTSDNRAGKYGKNGYYTYKEKSLSPFAEIKTVGGKIGKEFNLHEIIDVNSGKNNIFVSIYLIDRKCQRCQVMLDVIAADSNERIGESILLNDYETGIYVTYKITGHIRFRLTRFHFKHFGNGKDDDESGLPSVSGIFVD